MSEVEIPTCDVCGQRPGIGIASSTLGPISLSYCRECNFEQAEPKWLCEANIEMCGGLEGMADWAKEVPFFEAGAYHRTDSLNTPS